MSKPCILTCVERPDRVHQERLLTFLRRKYGKMDQELEVRLDPELLGGFTLTVDGYTYDYSVRGRMRQMGDALRSSEEAPKDVEALVQTLRREIQDFHPKAEAMELGTVLEIGDGIATADGLDRAAYGELVRFENGTEGMVMDLRADSVGIILLGDEAGLGEGSRVCRTGRTVQVPVGDALLGRVVNALGAPIDDLGPIHAADHYPVEREAGGVITREPVTVPLQTGILAIDAMVPIGRGQRELIVGDRQTGKTAIAVDAMLNQKDTGVICIYAAIGQKASSVARVQETLKKYRAMGHCIIVSAAAGDSPSLQYIAPYAATAMAEYFMERGRDVLIVYDDLSKHAVAYRTLSLLLKRSPGREAYPGDVFYLHSRLLERSCRVTKEYGGGSITALPIIETQAGDVSAYIPTNVISITDGQIYLETGLFFAGQRPAINVGLSVSRVGGAAQTKAVKKSAGTLRIDLARFRELEVFTQFSSDLDKATQQTLDHGKRLLELLKQPLYQPMSVSRQAVLLYIATQGLLDDVPLEQIRPLINGFMEELETRYSDILAEVQKTGDLGGVAIETVRAALAEYKSRAAAAQ